jgi:hypothetical protein
MMKTLNVLLASAALALSAGMASASTIYADSVISFDQGSCTGGCLPERSDPNEALGAPDGDDGPPATGFVSLGFGGEIVLGFSSGPFGSGNATVWEVTTRRLNTHNEAIGVYSVFNGVSSALLGVINNITGSGSVFVTGAFDSIRLVDMTLLEFPNTTSFDGFDVDAVGVSNVSPIPLPAAGFLLLAGLGGLAAVRRKKN